MRIGHIVVHRWKALFRRSHAETDLQREIDLHLEQLRKEHMTEGMTESEALLATRRDFGPVALTEERCRDARGINFLEDLARDLEFAFRALRKSPSFTLTALLALALGIGANSAIYSFMDAIMMRTLPVPDPQSLVILNWRAKSSPTVAHSQHGDGGSPVFPYPAWELLRDHDDTLSTLFAFASAGRLNLVAGNQAFLGRGEYVSGNYFSGAGTLPAAGRLIGNEDDRTGAPVAVISYRMWQQRFNSSAKAVGQTILINQKAFIIAGVTAPDFYGLNPRDLPDIFVPLHCLAYIDPRVHDNSWFNQSDNYWVQLMGRLRPNVTLRQSEAAMAGLFHRFVAATATNDKERANLPELWLQQGGLGLDSLRRQYSKPLYILLAMTAVILAIACSNVANLLLSRAAVRRREIAVRLSLGAGRGRIVRQLLTESIVVALLGGIMGLFVAGLGVRFLTWLLTNGEEDFVLHVGIDERTLLFTLTVSVLTGILFGFAPAIQATRVDVAPALKECRGGSLRGRYFGLQFALSHALVAGQIAFSLLLVVAAGLFVRTMIKLNAVPAGFNTEKLLVFNVDAKQAGYDERRGEAFYETLRQKFASIPGVRATTMTDMPLVADSASSNGIIIPGMPAARDQRPATSITLAGPYFFQTMQIPILLGRGIGEQDAPDAQRIAVVNEVFAKKFFPGLNPVGKHFALEEEKPIDVQIVGVARNSLYSSLKSAVPPVAYLPWSQSPPGWLIGGMYYEIRTAGDPLAVTDTVRKVVREANPLLPVADVKTQIRYIQATIAPERTFADLCTCFGLLALLIACVGLYGTTAYAVARRTNEIGIRIALGAQRGNVVWMVQRDVLVLSLAGLGIGLGIARGTARFVASFLFDVAPDDPVVFGLAAMILLICALAAGYAPALRASSIDPMRALRNE